MFLGTSLKKSNLSGNTQIALWFGCLGRLEKESKSVR